MRTAIHFCQLDRAIVWLAATARKAPAIRAAARSEDSGVSPSTSKARVEQLSSTQTNGTGSRIVHTLTADHGAPSNFSFLSADRALQVLPGIPMVQPPAMRLLLQAAKMAQAMPVLPHHSQLTATADPLTAADSSWGLQTESLLMVST